MTYEKAKKEAENLKAKNPDTNYYVVKYNRIWHCHSEYMIPVVAMQYRLAQVEKI